jgi:hypothetical protein
VAVKRFPWASLEAQLRLTLWDGQPCTTRALQALKLGVPPRQISRWQKIGVDFWQADKLAVRLGVMPYVIWPEWLEWSILWVAQGDAAELDKKGARCDSCNGMFLKKKKGHRFCSEACQMAGFSEYRRKWVEKNRERVQALEAAYREANRESIQEYRRRYRAQNREKLREKRREHYKVYGEIEKAKKREQYRLKKQAVDNISIVPRESDDVA